LKPRRVAVTLAMKTKNGISSYALRNKPLPGRIDSEFDSPGGADMGRYLLLWLLGVPLPILVLIYAFGGLH
jgi:hypothetical protein